ncbi:MAG TPA: nuclear transport factor 2 family protein [Acidobacteriaceae bacterium]|jgi:ketosteroid isomerase-like protein|nr:nuclear transport factor 2 family protein [Acidobacteriaceae bacterium]
MLAVGLLLLFANPAWAWLPHRSSHDLQKHIETLEMQWRDAVIHHNVRVMDRLLADDYLGISANGTVETKAEELAQSRAGTLRIKSLDLSDIKVRIYGNTAVVTSRAELTGMNGQSDISGNYRYTRVYNKRYGQWKIISFEASRIHDEDARAKH